MVVPCSWCSAIVLLGSIVWALLAYPHIRDMVSTLTSRGRAATCQTLVSLTQMVATLFPDSPCDYGHSLDKLAMSVASV
jgi:hypothetical protein